MKAEEMIKRVNSKYGQWAFIEPGYEIWEGWPTQRLKERIPDQLFYYPSEKEALEHAVWWVKEQNTPRPWFPPLEHEMSRSPQNPPMTRISTD